MGKGEIMEAYDKSGKVLIATNLDHEHAQMFQEMGFRIVGKTFRSPRVEADWVMEYKLLYGKDGLD